MKGVRFYLEFPDKKTKKQSGKNNNGHSGNVTAVFFENYQISANKILFDIVGSVFFQKNSPVCSSTCSEKWLYENCKRISEKLAREIHPQLFLYLDDE
jgi:hypothetical protein